MSRTEALDLATVQSSGYRWAAGRNQYTNEFFVSMRDPRGNERIRGYLSDEVGWDQEFEPGGVEWQPCDR